MLKRGVSVAEVPRLAEILPPVSLTPEPRYCNCNQFARYSPTRIDQNQAHHSLRLGSELQLRVALTTPKQ